MTEMATLLAEHVPAPGLHDTALDGVQLFRVDAPFARVTTVYPPSLCVILQQAKRVHLDGCTYEYAAGQTLCVTMSIPVEAEVPAATPDAPVLGLMVSLESQVAAETIVACQAARTSGDPAADVATADSPGGLGVVPWDRAFTDALWRMLDLVGHPEAARILGPGRVREVLYAAIQGKAGALIRDHRGGGQEIARIVGYVRDHLHEPISVDDLARRAGMSRAVFDRRFKAATTYAPLQFIKAMRLNNAVLLLRQGLSVSEAAYAVGYSSPSQFSREFRRRFGRPPRDWVRAQEGNGERPSSVPFNAGSTTVGP